MQRGDMRLDLPEWAALSPVSPLADSAIGWVDASTVARKKRIATVAALLSGRCGQPGREWIDLIESTAKNHKIR